MKIIVANPDARADLLLASFLSVKLGGPLLYVSGQEGLSQVNQTVASNDVKEILFVSSEENLDPSIEEKFSQKGLRTQWIHGEDPYILSVEIAKEFFPDSTEFILLNPEFPEEGISAPSIGSKKNAALLYVQKDTIPTSVLEFLKIRECRHFHILASDKAISSNVEDALNQIYTIDF